jgi:two-component system, cell cycle response regulator DivK
MAGYHVLTADTGTRAIEIALREQPDILVMDLDLPGITGLEAARALRQSARTSAIPLIAATGYSHASQLKAAEAAWLSSVLVKFCDPAVLVSEYREVAVSGPPSESSVTLTR